MMATTTTEIFFISREAKSPTLQRQLDRFEEWFSRCHNTLHFTARLILDGAETAEFAVQSCRLKASRIPHNFDREGAFRSWILRLLITEALSMLPRPPEKAR
jgi:DNA-directed RNA polymerase specialized sigma24 family protein